MKHIVGFVLKAATLSIFGLAFLSTSAMAYLEEEYSDDDWSGKVNWEEGFVYASGIGTANMAEMVNEIQAEQVSLTTAKHLAYRALYEIIGRISIDGTSIYRKQLMADDILKIETQGQLENVQVWKKDFSWTTQGSPKAVVTVRLPINGGLSKPAASWAGRQAVLPRFEGTGTPSSESFTGLIVDARGVDVHPCICPKILTDDGQRVVYGPGIGDAAKGAGMGFAAYAGSMQDARRNLRSGNNPLVVRALKVSGQNQGDLIISADDAVKVLGADIRNHILKDCKVIFLVR